MRLTARRIVAIAALALTTFAATHAGDVSRQAGIIYQDHCTAHTTIQAGIIYQDHSTAHAAAPNGIIYQD